MVSLDELARKHGTGKGPDVHGYSAAYQAFLEPLRDRELRLLEIGIGNGASLRMWEEYLPNARLYAIDEDPAAAVHGSERTRVFIGDQTDRAFLAQVVGVTGELDVLIDDGSHHPDHQRVSLEALFPHVRDGGLYAIEDLGCAFSPRYGPAAGLGNPASIIEYLKGILDVIHASPPLGGHLGDAISARVRALHFFPQLAILVKGPARERLAGTPDARVRTRPHAPRLNARLRRARWRLQKLRRRWGRKLSRAPVVTGIVALLVSFAASATTPRSATPSPRWQSRAQQTLAAREYEIRSQPKASCAPPGYSSPEILQAPNRAQNLRSCFTPGGVAVVPRTGDASWHWGLALSAFGDGTHVQEALLVGPTASGNRVEYAHGPLTEWYVNGENGLEEGFTLHEAVTPTNETLLRIRLGGDLRAVQDGQGIAFHSANHQRVLDYAKLFARDASGTELPASMAVVDDSIEIRIATAGARYPVTVDPLATTASWTAEANQAGAELGWSVATAGDVNGDGYSDVIVGAPLFDNGENNEGRAFVYLGSPTGLGATPAWTAEANQAGANFGWSVATAGDVNGDGFSDVIVGAPYQDNGQLADAGRAFVYLGSATGLAAAPIWSPQSDQGFANFGYSVATAGDVNGDGYSDVIVGAYQYDHGEADEGQAYVYLGGAAGPASAPAWTGESNQVGANFGFSVASAGDVNGDGFSDVIVGAPLYDNGQFDEGRAFVYLGSASGLATTAAWTAESDSAGAQFGYSVASAGDLDSAGYSDVVIGAPFYTNGEVGEGSAYVYLGSPSGLASTPRWTTESNQANASLGWSVATAGDVNGDGNADIIIGALAYQDTLQGEGRAYVYFGNTFFGISSSTAPWIVDGAQAGANFGVSVATAGDVNGDGYSDVIVGAYGFSDGQSGEGAVFVYHGGGVGFASKAYLGLESNQAASRFGYSVARAGDVNGDGFSDVIIGAPGFSNGQAGEGRVSVYNGGAGGFSSFVWTAESDQAGAQFGLSVASAGDVNGDGYGDVIVGATNYTNGEQGEGRASVYLGGATGLASTPAWTAESNQAGAEFGIVASAGDVNGDGYSDVIVGAPSYSNGQQNEGRAYVYLGSRTGLSLTPAWTAESNQAGAGFGVSVASAGDVNGDGYSDVIVGSFRYTDGQTQEGAAFVYLGSATGLGATPAWTAESNVANSSFGWSVASAGDVNGDGYSDVIVGAPDYNDGVTMGGLAAVYLGGPTGLSTVAVSKTAGTTNERYGYSVASAGDVNDDGYTDIVVGAPEYAGKGLAVVRLGGKTGISDAPALFSVGDQADEKWGWSVSSAGNVVGDGFCDVLISAFQFDHGEADEGGAFLYLGNGNEFNVRQWQLQQMRPGPISGPLAPLDASGSLSGVDLFVIGRSPFGRGQVRLQYEVKALGTPLDGTALQLAPDWRDTGSGSASGAPLEAFVQNLHPGTAYHWRLRVGYRPSTTPFQSWGPWLTLAANGLQETDFRTEKDTDSDGYFDRLDNCPYFSNPAQTDTDLDGRGDACECTDQNGDGRNTVADLVAINTAIFNPSIPAPLCDGNNDGKCNVNDIIAANRELFVPKSSICARQPFPGP